VAWSYSREAMSYKQIKYYLFIIIPLFANSCLNRVENFPRSQNPVSDNRICLLESIALNYLEKNEIDSAIIYFRKAISEPTTLNHEKKTRIYLSLASCYFEKNLLKECISTIETVLRLHEINNLSINNTWVRANIMIANCYRLLHNYDLALHYIAEIEDVFLSTPKEHSNDEIKCILPEIKMWKALILSNIGEYELSIKENLSAIGIIDKTKCSECSKANHYSLIGSVYLSMKNFDKGEKYYSMALKIFKNCYGDTSLFYADNLTELGLLFYENQNYKRALECFIKSHDILKSFFQTNDIEFAYSYNNLGDTYCKLGNVQKGINYYLSALKLFEEYNLKEEFCVVLHNLGNVYFNNSEHAQAIKYYKESLRLSKLYKSQNNIYRTYTYQRLGELYLKQANFIKSIYYSTKAIQELSLIKQESVKYSIHFLQNGILSKPVLLECLYLKGSAEFKLYIENGDLQLLDSCEISFAKAFQILDLIRNKYDSEKTKLKLGKINSQLVSSYLQVLLSKKNNNSNNIDRDNKILELVERNKHSAFRSHIQMTKPSDNETIPPIFRNKIDSLNKKIRFYQHILSGDEYFNPLNYSIKYEDELFSCIYKMDSLCQYLKERYPDFYYQQYNFKFHSIKEIQNHISDTTGIINYFYDDSLFIVFVIRKSKYTIHYTKITNQFIKEISDYKKSIVFSDKSKIVKLGFSLYQKLIEPIQNVASGLKSLIIVPDKLLSNIPFETIPISNKEIYSDNISFLINEFDISYQYSLNLWYINSEFELKRHPINFKEDFVGHAPFTDLKGKSNLTYSKLPFSKTEINLISTLFNTKGLIAKSFCGGLSNERLIASSFENAKIVHIASHSDILVKPKEYCIVLSDFHNTIKTEKNINSNYTFINPDDGRLTIPEIYNLNVKSSLVTICTCKSGLGNIRTGEGMNSIALGFYYSGASNILYTLWDISDKHSYEFMISFYEYVIEGNSYSRALRKAKLDFINSEYQLPIFWSGYLLIG
jgi:CHAT domain-containing protein